MARIRTIKPDAFLSESLSDVPRGTRWTFAGLWTYADDAGRGRDDARLIKAALYPIDDDVTLSDVKHDLELLTDIGAVCRYVVDGRSYLHMPNWAHQKINRPTPAKSPPCPLHEDSVSLNGAVTEPSGWEKEGKGKEGEKEGSGSDGTAADAPKALAVITDQPRDDVERVCSRLATRITENGSKQPTITKAWRDAARLMLDRDERAEADVLAAIDWCQRDEFWRGNVLSMPKLREKYDQMRLQAQRRAGGSSDRQQRDQDMFDRQMARAREREQQMGSR